MLDLALCPFSAHISGKQVVWNVEMYIGATSTLSLKGLGLLWCSGNPLRCWALNQDWYTQSTLSGGVETACHYLRGPNG